MTNQGDLVQHQVRMMQEKIRTIGVSILGGKSKTQGKYELGIESIRAVNEVGSRISVLGVDLTCWLLGVRVLDGY
jgi:hypothetical protein